MGGNDWEKEKKPQGDFFTGFKLATTEAMDKLRDFRQLGVDVANQLTTNLGSAFSSFIDDSFSGQLKKGKDYFAMFGRSILKIFSEMIADMAAKWLMFQTWQSAGGATPTWMKWVNLASKSTAAINGLAGGYGNSSVIQGGVGGTTTDTEQFGETWSPDASSYHRGGIVRAHNGLAIDEVPIIAQTGERVLSRKQNAEYERGMGGVNIIINPQINIYAHDTQTGAEFILKHKKEIAMSVCDQIMKNNNALRGAIKHARR